MTGSCVYVGYRNNVITSICIIKIGGHFLAIFLEKPWAIVQGFFSKFGVFKKWS